MNGFRAHLRRFKRQLQIVIMRAIVDTVKDDKHRIYINATGLANQHIANIEHLQQYGHFSHPLPGAQTVLACIAGNPEHPIAILVDDPRYKPDDTSPGDSVSYNHQGDFIHIKADGSIVLKASSKIRMETPKLECTGDIIDRCDEQGNSIKDLRDIYNGHNHSGDSGGTTGQPNQGM